MTKQQIFFGLFWGAFMYVCMIFLLPYFGLIDAEINLKRALIGVPVWFLTGQAVAYFVKSTNKPKKQIED